jgi:hypothetical protein
LPREPRECRGCGGERCAAYLGGDDDEGEELQGHGRSWAIVVVAIFSTELWLAREISQQRDFNFNIETFYAHARCTSGASLFVWECPS